MSLEIGNAAAGSRGSSVRGRTARTLTRLRAKLEALVVVGVSAAALVAVPGAAHAGTSGVTTATLDVSSSSFYVDYGASVTRGSIQWGSGYTSYATGYLKAVSNYRLVCVEYWTGQWTYWGSRCTDWVAPGETRNFDLPLTLQYAGGVQHVYVKLYTQDWAERADYCNRTRIYCWNG
jgi:hypothetical protein